MLTKVKPGYYVYNDSTLVCVDLMGYVYWLNGTDYINEWELHNSFLDEVKNNDVFYNDTHLLIEIENYNINNFEEKDNPWYKELLEIKKELIYEEIIKS